LKLSIAEAADGDGDGDSDGVAEVKVFEAAVLVAGPDVEVIETLPEKNSPISTEDNRTQVEESRGQWQRSETSEIRCLGTLREASEGWSNFAVIRAA